MIYEEFEYNMTSPAVISSVNVPVGAVAQKGGALPLPGEGADIRASRRPTEI